MDRLVYPFHRYKGAVLTDCAFVMSPPANGSGRSACSVWFGARYCGQQSDCGSATPLDDRTAFGEIMHLALPPIAFCLFGEGQIGLEKAGIGSPGFFTGYSEYPGMLLLARHLRVLLG